MRDKRDRAITCVFRHDLHLTPMFSGLYKKICLKESEVWRKVISNKIIVTLVTQGLPSVPLRKISSRVVNPYPEVNAIAENQRWWTKRSIRSSWRFIKAS